MNETLVAQGMVALGLGAYVPLVLAVIGLASVVSTVYPQTWAGALAVHKIALLIGKASPAAPASEVPTMAVIVPKDSSLTTISAEAASIKAQG
jgi:hypothetical protein